MEKFKGFIVGEGRSGTTLFSAMLNRNSGLLVTPETHFYRNLECYPGGIEAFIAEYPNSLEGLFEKIDKTAYWSPSPNRIIARFPAIETPRDVHKLFLEIGEDLILQTNKKYWLEKTPGHIRTIPFINTIVRGKNIYIHVVRDGRAVAESLTRMDWASDNLYENCVRWLSSLEQYHLFLEHKKNVISVKYEDLVLNPKKTLEIVMEFIGLKFENNMLESSVMDLSLIEKGHTHKNKVMEGLDKANIDAWVNVFSINQKDISNRLLGSELVKWSYNIDDFKFDEQYNTAITPFVYSSADNFLGKAIEKIFTSNKLLWIKKVSSIGDGIIFENNIVQFEEVLSYRCHKNNKINIYFCFIISVFNVCLIKMMRKRLFFYFDHSFHDNDPWRLRKIIFNLVLKNTTDLIITTKHVDFFKSNFPKLRNIKMIII